MYTVQSGLAGLQLIPAKEKAVSLGQQGPIFNQESCHNGKFLVRYVAENAKSLFPLPIFFTLRNEKLNRQKGDCFCLAQ